MFNFRFVSSPHLQYFRKRSRPTRAECSARRRKGPAGAFGDLTPSLSAMPRSSPQEPSYRSAWCRRRGAQTERLDKPGSRRRRQVSVRTIRVLVGPERSFCACRNWPRGDIESIYRWHNAIESAAESLMLIKTRADLLPAIGLRLRELHSYEVPELVAVPIGDGAKPYLDWLIASSRNSQKTS
jgi:periplasmic divalent cation tolerance protein